MTILTVRDYIGLAEVRGDVGIEIEVEASKPLPIRVPGTAFQAKADGSLRVNGIEYVSRGALNVKEMTPKLVDLMKIIDQRDYGILYDSPRTSVHVHVNVMKLSLLQVVTSLTCALLLETAMMEYCGEHRKGNQYCLRARDAEGLIQSYVAFVAMARTPFFGMPEESLKYSNLNVCTVARFGTLEFRGMRGTLDPVVIQRWADACHSVVHNSAQLFKTPADVVDQFFLTRDMSGLLDSVLGSPFTAELKAMNPHWEQDINDSIGLLLPFAYSAKWDEWAKQATMNRIPRPLMPANGGVRLGNMVVQVAAPQGLNLFHGVVEQPHNDRQVMVEPAPAVARIDADDNF